ncbi:MAG: dihydrofolate reductase family protein [Chloroflexi bacterium]|nr:dihydrofolate reductase family protein [Chloroflexota bacterium]
MRKLVLTEWVSLDGYTAGPNNDMSFVGESFDEEMGSYESQILDTADTLVLGRVTYQSFAGSWPHVPDSPTASEPEKDYARRLNAMRKLVFSKTLASADWTHSTLLREIDRDAMRRLKQEDGRDLLIYGSANLVQQLTRLGLIDEYQLLVHPVLLGGGTRLFGETERTRLQLVSATPFRSGVALLTYRHAEA